MNVEDVIKRLPVGHVYHCGGRTIGEGEFALLTSLTWTIGEAHSNRESMAESKFGERVLASGLTLPLIGGLATRAGVFDMLRKEYGVGPLVLVGYEDVRFTEAILPGDTVYVAQELLEAKATSSSNRGLLKFLGTMTKEGGKVLTVAKQVYLFEV